jgi:hypothetical protein
MYHLALGKKTHFARIAWMSAYKKTTVKHFKENGRLKAPI